MKLLIPLIFLVAIFSSPLMSQTSLGGKITDGDSGEELIAANVSIYQNGVFISGIATDFDGNYKINLDPGTYDVEASYIGYQTIRINGVVVRAGRNNRLSLSFGQGVVSDNSRKRRNERTKRLRPYLAPDKDEKVVKEILNNTPQAHEHH